MDSVQQGMRGAVWPKKDQDGDGPKPKKTPRKKRDPRIPPKKDAKWADGTPVDPKTNLGKAYFRTQEALRFVRGGYLMNGFIGLMTAQQFTEFFQFWNWERKGLKFGSAAVVGLFLVSMYKVGGDPLRVLRAMYETLQDATILSPGLVVFATAIITIYTYPEMLQEHTLLADQVGWKKFFFSVIVATGYAFIAGAGTEVIARLNKMLTTTSDTRIMKSIDRTLEYSSYAIPILIILLGIGYSGIFKNVDIGSQETTNRVGRLFRGGRR